MDLRNRQYFNNATGAHYKQFFPTINNEIPINNDGSGTILRVQTGHCKLNSHLFRLGQHPTGLCEDCHHPQTVKHHSLECAKHCEARKKLKSSLKQRKYPI